MPCPNMVPVPGNNPAAPAVWNERVVLSVSDGVGFPDFAQITVSVKSGGLQPRPVQVEVASAVALTLVLPGPPAAADRQGPHSLIVKGPVTGTCTVDVAIQGVALPAEPTPADLTAVLEDLAARLELSLAGHSGRTQNGLPSLPPGSGVHAGLVNFPPFVTPAGAAVPLAREVHRFFGSGGWGRAPITGVRGRLGGVLDDVLGGSGGVFDDVLGGGEVEPTPPPSPPGTVPIAPSVEWKLFREDGSQLVQGEDYLVDTVGMGAAAIVLVPPISKSKSAPAQKITVKVSGKLYAFGSAIGGSNVSFPIPELAEELLLETLALPVPFFAGFRLEKFAPGDGEGHLGAVYVQVPPGWADTGVEALMAALDEARELLRPLDRIAFIAELLVGLRTLSRVLAAQSTVVVETGSVVPDLYRYRWFKHDHWYGWDSWFEDLYVEDRISSFVALGLKNQAVQCYSAKNNDAAQEWLEVQFTDPVGMAVVNRLRTKAPENALGRGATVTARVLPKDQDDQYDESFSSITLVEA